MVKMYFLRFRCVYLANIDVDIHGCVQGGRKWGTPIFEKLGLLDHLTTEDHSEEFDLDYPISK